MTVATTTLSAPCPSCATEIGLDAFIGICIQDAEVRRLIAEVVAMCPPLGRDVVRYVRLHKPEKQGLRFEKLRAILLELLPAVQAGQIEHRGRLWAAPAESWRLALQAVFDAQAKGKLRLPLTGNAYLFGVLTNMADELEAAQEKAAETDKRNSSRTGPTGAVNAAQAITPSMAAVIARDAQARPMPDEVRGALKSIKKGGTS